MPRAPADQWIQQGIARVLGYGVALAAIVVQVGGIAYLARHGGEAAHYSVFRGEPSDLRHVSGILRGALALDERSLIQFGLLILVATPVARVAFSILAFALQKDRLYVTITGLVFAILMYSLAGVH